MKWTRPILTLLLVSGMYATLFVAFSPRPVQAAPPQCFIVGNAVDADGNVLNTTAYIPAPASCVDHSASYAFTDFDPSWDPTTHFQDNECYVFSSPFVPPTPFNSWNDSYSGSSCGEVAETQDYLGQLTDLETFFDNCAAANGYTQYDAGEYTCVDGLGNPIEDVSPTVSPIYDPTRDPSGDPDDPSTDQTLYCGEPGNSTPGVSLSNADPSDPDAASCIPYDPDRDQDDLDKNPIFVYLGIITNFVLGGVGLAVVGVMVVGGYQYITSAGNPQMVASAQQKLMIGITSLILYIFAWALINWLVPGGLLN